VMQVIVNSIVEIGQDELVFRVFVVKVDFEFHLLKVVVFWALLYSV
jgi:hypothetical protein